MSDDWLAAHLEAQRQEAARADVQRAAEAALFTQEIARQEAARLEAARQEITRQEAARAQASEAAAREAARRNEPSLCPNCQTPVNQVGPCQSCGHPITAEDLARPAVPAADTTWLQYLADRAPRTSGNPGGDPGGSRPPAERLPAAGDAGYRTTLAMGEWIPVTKSEPTRPEEPPRPPFEQSPEKQARQRAGPHRTHSDPSHRKRRQEQTPVLDMLADQLERSVERTKKREREPAERARFAGEPHVYFCSNCNTISPQAGLCPSCGVILREADAYLIRDLLDSAERFINLDLGIDTRTIKGPRDRTAAPGRHPRDQRKFWTALLVKHHEVFSPKNTFRILTGEPPLVDGQWLKYHPGQELYRDDELEHHHWHQGPIAFGIPKHFHERFTALLHPQRYPNA